MSDMQATAITATTDDDLDFDLNFLDVKDVDIVYQETDDAGCEGGACKI
jgi:hypothetical protein